MKKYYLPDDVRKADKIASEKLQIPSVILMENASKNAAVQAVKMAGGIDKNFLLLAGHGNNGGDAFATARHLIIAGASAVVIKSTTDGHYTNDAAVNLKILRHIDSPLLQILDSSQLSDEAIENYADRADCILDGLLGTGTKGAPRGEIARIINIINGKKHNILAIDIPSGIDAENGNIYSPCLNADKTVTFLAPKSGMAYTPARDCCGEIFTADIGAPVESVLPKECAVTLYDKNDIKKMLPTVSRNIHKTQRGSLMIIAGSYFYRGAPLLSAHGALRCGAGIVYLAVPDFIASSAASNMPEAIILPLKTKDGDIVAEEAVKTIEKFIAKCHAVVAGPGCGRSAGVKELFDYLWNKCDKPLLLDADMLWYFAQNKASLCARNDVVITPHSAEAANILSITPSDVDAARRDSVIELSEKVGCALLKGKNTLISDGKSINMIDAGSPSLAVPGSGDVLSGVIGALIASKKMDITQSTLLGALIHAAAGEVLEAKQGVSGNLAGEIADEISKLFR